MSAVSDDLPARDAVFEVVRCAILELRIPGFEAAVVTEESRLVEDLGLDSLKFVDLTVALEDALGIAEFPMQEWVDAEVEGGRPLRVGSLVMACKAQLRDGQLDECASP